MKKTEIITRETITRYAQDTSDAFTSLIKFMLARAKDFSVLDFALFKLCLVSFGLYIGSKFAEFFKKFRIVILISFIISYAYMLWRIFIRED
ncbi:MAG TPA: hypothetical protein H9746_06480 [Candidatus Butyricicoccus avistercoris]|uniref:Uncharacterized protein n=1 Tax=Candidatus Butyricicoccus avistercoris TaxID=2838518 RepID=A0A9D1PJX5_9FIRM|nr:hypothetical protein [Candidatus Butyricicoccus avistercoris]